MMYLWRRIKYDGCDTVRRITLCWNTVLPWCREQCVLALRSAVCSSEKIRVPSRLVVKPKMYRPVPSGKKVPSRPVVEESTYRPVPSWKIICTVPSRPKKKNKRSRPVVTFFIYRPVPSRRDNLYLPFRPIVTIFIYRPVPSWNKKVIVLYRPVPSRKFTPTVPSRPIQATIIFIILPSRPVPSSFFSRQTSQNSTVPSRLEYYQPWKALLKSTPLLCLHPVKLCLYFGHILLPLTP